jgi:hypothetical protein
MITIKHRMTGETLCKVRTLQGAFLRGVFLRGADLRHADLRGALLQGAFLQGVFLRGADLRHADLQGADLRGAFLQGVFLRGADLRHADLQGADLRGAFLQGADLRGADLRGAFLQGADLRGAFLQGADLGEKFGKVLANGYFTTGPIGSRDDTLTAWHTDKDIFINTGCFFDSIELFRAAVIKTHGEESKHGKLYLGMCNVIEFKFGSDE